MEIIVIWSEKYRKKWWFSAFLNLVLLAGLLVFMRPLFETNDDTTIYELTAGAKGLYDSHAQQRGGDNLADVLRPHICGGRGLKQANGNVSKHLDLQKFDSASYYSTSRRKKEWFAR